MNIDIVTTFMIIILLVLVTMMIIIIMTKITIVIRKLLRIDLLPLSNEKKNNARKEKQTTMSIVSLSRRRLLPNPTHH